MPRVILYACRVCRAVIALPEDRGEEVLRQCVTCRISLETFIRIGTAGSDFPAKEAQRV